MKQNTSIVIPDGSDVLDHIKNTNFMDNFSFKVVSDTDLFKIILNSSLVKVFVKNLALTDTHIKNVMKERAELVAKLAKGNVFKMIWISQILYLHVATSEIARSLSFETSSYEGEKKSPFLEGFQDVFTDAFNLLVFRVEPINKKYNSHNREVVINTCLEASSKNAIGYLNLELYLEEPKTSLDEIQEIIRRIENGK